MKSLLRQHGRRRKVIAAFGLSLGILCPVFGQTGVLTEAPPADRTYKILREDENWTFLRDKALRRDVWDPVKYIPMSWKSDEWYSTVGGEIREVWEQIGNDEFGQTPYWNGYLLQRYMLHVDTHYGPHVRTFVQLKSGLEDNRIGGPRIIDEKRLDFLAAYLEVGTAGEREDRDFIQFRVGRQELNYGSGRLVSVREGPNVRQSFDGFKIRSRVGGWHLDGWAVRPDLDKPGFFNNAPIHATGFWGAYATRPVTELISADAYYLGLNRQSATFNRGTAHEVRHTLGVRLWRPIALKQKRWDFDDEAVWQFGCFGTGGIRAWTVASDHGYSFLDTPLRPRLSVKADLSSGDDPNKKDLGTFNPIFPLGNYFGVLASTGPGPVNFMDIHPRLQTQLPRGVTVSTDWVFQWRQSTLDGIYTVPGSLLRPTGTSRARYVGDRPGIEAKWQVDRHMSFQADYGIFYPGSFIKQTRPAKNLGYWALWAGYKF